MHHLVPAVLRRGPRLFPRLHARSTHSCIDPSLELTPDQVEMQKVAKRFAQEEMMPNMSEWDEKKTFPVETLRRAAEIGFGAIYCCDEHGGSGLSRLDASIIFEALAGGCVSTTAYISIHNMCAWMVDTFGSEHLRKSWVPRLASMQVFSSYCLTEPDSGSDAASLTTSAVKDGNDYIVNGSKAFISGSGKSGVLIVMVRTGDASPRGISCLLIEAGRKGISYGAPEVKLGWNTHPARVVTFEDCRVPASNLLGAEGDGFSIAMKGLNGGRINIGSCSLGGAQSALDIAIEYMKTRKQFGQRICDFQWNQFQVAEAATKIATSRLLIRQAARALDRGEPVAVPLCSMAKLHSTTVCQEVVDQCMQFLGGYGYLKSYPIEQYLRDLRVHRILEGTNEIMRMLVSRDVLKD